MSDVRDDTQATCAAVAAWLHAQRTLGHFALALTLVAALVLLGSRGEVLAVLLAAAVLALAPAERYFALRMAFDGALFEAWSRGALDGAHIDRALVRLRLAPPPLALRPLEARIDGARRLQRMRLLLVVAQAVLQAGALVAAVFHQLVR